MRLYPMIHISNGRCYNPTSDSTAGRQNIFTSSPVKLAKHWEASGASRIHITDVDGATAGSPMHQELVQEIIEAVSIPIQYGGGLRNIKDIDDFIGMGVARVVCSTTAVQNIHFVTEAIQLFGAARFAVGIDAIEGMVAIEGRAKVSNFNTVSLASEMRKAGVTKLVYTDVTRNMLKQRPSLENTRELVEKSGLEIVLGGGISSIRDLEDISSLNVDGVLLGSALYDGSIDLAEAISIYEKG